MIVLPLLDCDASPDWECILLKETDPAGLRLRDGVSLVCMETLPFFHLYTRVYKSELLLFLKCNVSNAFIGMEAVTS